MQIFSTILLVSAIASLSIINHVKALPTTSLLQKRDPTSKDDIEAILYTHNLYRSKHGAPPLSWSSTLADYAESWSSQCVVKYSSGDYGENIAGRTEDWSSTIEVWYNESSHYNYKKPGFSAGSGHFTQLVWKNTTTVGCSMTYCDQIEGSLFVCEYEPRGNIVWGGEDPALFYKANIIAPNY